MSQPIVIVGSGFAAWQLVRTLRRQQSAALITVITATSGDDYNKPDLSHVFTRKQQATDLIKASGAQLAVELDVRLMPHTRVEEINPNGNYLIANGERIDYQKLVLATGAKTFIPPMQGNAKDQLITLNSLEEYQQGQEQLTNARSVLVIGAGMIGTEIAMDLASTGRKVILANREESILPGLLPEFISSRLLGSMITQNVQFELGAEVTEVNTTDTGFDVRLSNNNQHSIDAVICAAGIVPNTQLARSAGLQVNRGIVVNQQMQTSHSDIYALGDCAEIDGRVMPFLQAIIHSTNTLAKTLAGESAKLALPAMMIKLKTPLLPIQFGGNTSHSKATWKVDATAEGMLAQAFDDNDQLMGFVATESMMPKAFPLLRQLPALI
ncbi:NADH:flavorubredoxin reductase NorW [Endozoicomonadaceae bacterium StTr2]